MQTRIVLVGTTHPGNIGAAARAMKNMGQRDLALVKPRFFPHEEATARASGAEDVLENATVCASLEEAVGACTFVAGTSARSRSIGWPGMTPRQCAARLVREAEQGYPAVVFGPEKSGLTNEDLERCHTHLTIPTAPEFSSLNLAMAVQVVTYELRVAALGEPDIDSGHDDHIPLATTDELEHYYAHLETVLAATGFLDPDNPRHLMRRLRRLYARAMPDKNEINILRGILSSIDRTGGQDR